MMGNGRLTPPVLDTTAGTLSRSHAVTELRDGGCVVIADDLSDDGASTCLVAASRATSANVATLVRHTSGLLYATIDATAAKRLDLPPMIGSDIRSGEDRHPVSVDAREGCTTGISASDRALTARTLADSRSQPGDLTRPGHLLPMLVEPGGLLKRHSVGEAASDLVSALGDGGVALFGHVVSRRHPTEMATITELKKLADNTRTPLVTLSELVLWRSAHAALVKRIDGPVATSISPSGDDYSVVAYAGTFDDRVHLASGAADVRGADDVAVIDPSRRHRDDTLWCDCGTEFRKAARAARACQHGAAIWLDVNACRPFRRTDDVTETNEEFRARQTAIVVQQIVADIAGTIAAPADR